jgi:hypothetical protein
MFLWRIVRSDSSGSPISVSDTRSRRGAIARLSTFAESSLPAYLVSGNSVDRKGGQADDRPDKHDA